jgi:hypothetical protein
MKTMQFVFYPVVVWQPNMTIDLWMSYTTGNYEVWTEVIDRNAKGWTGLGGGEYRYVRRRVSPDFSPLHYPNVMTSKPIWRRR